MRLSRTCALTLAALVLAACDSGGTAAPGTLPTTAPAPSSSASSTVPTTAESTTSTGATTTIGSSAPATTVPGTIGLSEGGPWTLVDSAPGITTPGLVYELMPKLWVYLPTVEDAANGIAWTFNEDDRPIIEAYLHARLVYFKAITANPMDFSSPDWAKWYADGGASYFEFLKPRVAANQTADLESGVVLRPVVIGDDRSDTSAVVFDCWLDGGVFRNPDGTLAEGSSPGVSPYGSAARLSMVDGRWLTIQSGSQPEACG